MTSSPHMGDVVVEIAFDSGFSTPAASRTWTDVSEWVELRDNIDITFGRGDERGTAEANTLSLRLDNRDGRFTAARAASPYYPNIKLYRPIRVTATPVGGAESVRFLGYVNEWPTEWDGTDAYAFVTVTASSRMARLGLTASLRSIVEEEILADNPVAYYPLGEPEGSTSAADVSGDHADSLTLVGTGAAVTFGVATGPGTDDLTAATFAGGKYLSSDSPGPTGSGMSVEMFCLAPAGVTAAGLVRFGDMGLLINGLGQASVFRYNSSASIMSASGTTAIADGTTRHIAGTWDGTTLRVYVNGVEEGATADAMAPAGTAGFWVGNSLVASVPLTGQAAHAAGYDVALSAARIATHAAAGLTGFEGETSAERLERYAALGHIDPAEVDATGSTPLVHIDTTGMQVVETFRRVETSEGGVLYDARDGTLTMHPRDDRYLATAAFTLDMGAQQVEADFAPSLDASALTNDVTASNSGGTVVARYTSPASIADYGTASASIETAAQDPDEPLQAAAWLVEQYAEPRVRVASISVDILPLITATQDAILAATIGTLFTVTNLPSQYGLGEDSFFVEGYTETIGPESWVISFNVSSAWPYTSLFVIDSSEIDGPDLIAR